MVVTKSFLNGKVVGASMSRFFFASFSVFLTVMAVVGLFAPHAADAATKKKKKTVRRNVAAYLYNPRRHYKDEHVDLKNPVSRCDTPAMRTLHIQHLRQADHDAAKAGVTTSTTSGEGEALRSYQQGLALAWSAMEEPYCGYGAFGLSAARKSYEKSVGRIRQKFLDKVKGVSLGYARAGR